MKHMNEFIHRLNIAILGSTRGTDMQAIIDAINTEPNLNSKINAKIQVVISNQPDAYILERAKNHNLTAICIPSQGKKRLEFDQAVILELQKYPVDIVILIGFMRILTPEFVNYFDKKIINVHPSLLPKFAGGMDDDVHSEVIKSGEATTGCTVHLVSDKVDCGQILLQKVCNVDYNETPATLKSKVQKLEGQALIEVIQNWVK